MDPLRQPHHHDLQELASLYVLGLLEPAAQHAFEDLLRSAHPAALAALRSHSNAAAELALSQASAQPPAALKARLLDRIRSTPQANSPSTPQARPQASPQAALGAIRAHEGKWRETGLPGVTFKVLFHDREAALVTTLVRLAPGAVYPAHRHNKAEQCLIVEGDLLHDNHQYGPGDFTWAEPGSIDPQLSTRNGALLLIIGGRQTEFIET